MKLFISQDNSKFIRNIISSHCDGLQITSGNHKNILYQIQQKYQINAYIFTLKDLDKEVLQFIQDYTSRVKIFIYHDVINHDVVTKLSNCYHLAHIKDTNISINIISIPNLINTGIFFQTNNINKNEDCFVSFADNVGGFSEEVNKLLYPHNHLKIKIYGAKFQHHQNLGWTSESDKADILNNHKKYLAIDDSYSQEALICGCDIYNINSIYNSETINKDISTYYESYHSFLNNILT